MSEISSKSGINSKFQQGLENTDHFCENNIFRETIGKLWKIVFIPNSK